MLFLLVVTISRTARFTITSGVCTADLLDTTSQTYQDLADDVTVSISIQCQATGSIQSNGIACDVTDVVFTCGSINVDYRLSLMVSPGLEISADQYFDDISSTLVSAADNGTLLSSGNDVDSTSFAIGTSGKNCLKVIILL